MKTVSVSVPIPKDMWQEQQKMVRDAVGGKSKEEALAALVRLFKIEPVASLRIAAEKAMIETPMRFLVTSLTLGGDDKVVARSGSGQDPEREREAQIRGEIYRNLEFKRDISVLTTLSVAREQILFEHAFGLRDIREFIDNSPFIAPDRRESYAEGLIAGLRGDFATAAHRLIPQLENSLRHVLEERGASTFRVGRDGLQYEHDLNSLLYAKEIVEFLGEDLAMDMRGLFVESCSTNLRNRLMHGMVPDASSNGPAVAYCWWMILALTYWTNPSNSPELDRVSGPVADQTDPLS